MNGHGGNDFVPFIRQVQCDLNVHVFLCNWWEVGNDKYGEIFKATESHAGEMETSAILAASPELVEPNIAGDGRVRPYLFEALDKGWVRTSRTFAKLNDHCGVGDPSAATAEKGRKYFDLVCGRITAFLVQLAQAPIDNLFPHKP
jgi:creatinine amidohydrolase